MKTNKIILILLTVGLIAAGCNKQKVANNPTVPNPTPSPVIESPVPKPTQVSGPIVTIAGHQLQVEIADTTAEQLQGLSGRESLAENSGMLFVFTESHRYTFWMKDMKFPLDFIWIKDGKVFQIDANAPIEPGIKDSNLKIYIPGLPVNSVLEINAGWAEKNGIKVGDRVDFNQAKR